MARKDDELLQTGHKPRTSASGRDGTPKIIWVALLVCLVGAALLFRNPSGDVPTGIGENRTVVTVPGEETGAVAADTLQRPVGDQVEPRSGEVDLDQLVAELTPEPPDGKTAAGSPPTNTSRTPQTGAPATGAADRAAAQALEPKRRPDPAPPATRPQPAAEIFPAAEGPYLVQTGSYGGPENADVEAARLKALGFNALVKVSNMADDAIVYRVRIGYFETRAEAEAFIRANTLKLPGAIPVHR